MPLTRLPNTTAPTTVARVLASDPATAMADVLLAEAWAHNTPWTPFYDRADIGPEVWARWSVYLARRAAHCAAQQGFGEPSAGEEPWLARTLRELVQHAHPARDALRTELRRILDASILTTSTLPPALRSDSLHVWWRATLADLLAAGHLGAVTAEDLTEALVPWLDGRVNALSMVASWAVPALTTGLERGLLTSAQVFGYLEKRGGYALVTQIPHDRAMLELPGWRAAWWAYFQTAQAQALGSQWVEAVRLHCGNHAVTWSQWPADELEAWWRWLVTSHMGKGRVHDALPRLLERTLAQPPDGPWLGRQEAFHLALRPLLEAPEAAVREMGLHILGMTETRAPRRAAVRPRPPSGPARAF